MERRTQMIAIFLAVLIVFSVIVINFPTPEQSEEDETLIPDENFTLADSVDPHVQAYATGILSRGDVDDVVSWPSERLLPLSYEGSMRSPGGVLAGQMGSDYERCQVVRELLTVVNIPTRYAISGDSCWIEALVDDEPTWIPTSLMDNSSSLEMEGLSRGFVLPSEGMHLLSLIERTYSNNGIVNHTLIEGNLSDLSRGPIVAEYTDEGGILSLSIKIGHGEDAIVVNGGNLDDVNRHDLIFRHTLPNGTSTEHRRTLFNSNSTIGNQAPDPGSDIYGIWLGPHVVETHFLSIEYDRLSHQINEVDIGLRLYLIAAELAMQTDQAGYILFNESEIDGAFIYDELRIMITGVETRTIGFDGVTPSFDILANPRTLIGVENASSIQVALGWSDALTEATLFEIFTGQRALTTPAIFKSLFSEQPAGLTSRINTMDGALGRLGSEGISGEALVFFDPESNQSAKVIKRSTNLILLLNEDELMLLNNTAGDALDDYIFTNEGLILGTENEFSWPIELLLLGKGAALDYNLDVLHIESAQGALMTPKGTVISGIGSYNGDNLTFKAMVRLFEEIPEGETIAYDRADWHVLDNDGALLGDDDNSIEYAPSATDTSDARVMVMGMGKDTTSHYQSPFWLHPTHADSIHNDNSPEILFRTLSRDIIMNEFENGTLPIEINGELVEVNTVTVRGTDPWTPGEYSVTLARDGDTRLILKVQTPISDSVVTSIQTPNPLRLRGHVLSNSTGLEFGIENAELHDSGSQIGHAWPDGSIDIRVPGTAQATLNGSIAILSDSSGSMEDPVDSDCTGEECEEKREVVGAAIEAIATQAPDSIELAVWTFKPYWPTWPENCTGREEIDEISPWTMSRFDIVESGNDIATISTHASPLTAAVAASIANFEQGTWGHEQRLIVLSDGDNLCSNGLDTLEVPEGLEIHTIGIGFTEGSAEEIELHNLAIRTGGTYTRTSNATELSHTLTQLAIAPIPVPPPTTFEVEIRAQGYISSVVDFPVNQDNVTIFLEAEEDRDTPSLIAVMPGDSLPILEDTATIEMLNERRAERPNHVFIMPDREIDFIDWPNAFAWLEIDITTGETAAMTPDGLHGALLTLIYHGAMLTGMWAGTDSVMGNFGNCILLPDGCGENIGEITQTLCETSGDAGTYLSIIMLSFPNIPGYMIDTMFNVGMFIVRSACMGSPDMSGFIGDQIDVGIGEGIGAAFDPITGGAAGIAWTLLPLFS